MEQNSSHTTGDDIKTDLYQTDFQTGGLLENGYREGDTVA